jgi:hypothetical protein
VPQPSSDRDKLAAELGPDSCCRAALLWQAPHPWDLDFFGFFRQAIARRYCAPVLYTRTFHPVDGGGAVDVFGRTLPRQGAVVMSHVGPASVS